MSIEPRADEGPTERFRKHRFERLKKLPLGSKDFLAAVLSSLLVSAVLVTATTVVVTLVDSDHPVMRVYGAAFLALFFFLEAITMLGSYWGLLRARDHDNPSFPFRFDWAFGRACAGAGLSVAIAAVATAVFAGLILTAVQPGLT